MLDDRPEGLTQFVIGKILRVIGHRRRGRHLAKGRQRFAKHRHSWLRIASDGRHFAKRLWPIGRDPGCGWSAGGRQRPQAPHAIAGPG
jgi:hypothetical protein